MEQHDKSDPARQPPTPATLQYVTPYNDVIERRRRIVARVSGAVTAAVTVFAAVFFAILTSLDFTHTRSGVPPATVIIPGVLLVSLAGTTAFQHFHRRRRGFLAGVLIGLGLAALIEGACFITFH